jgi:nucleoside-diphosphate-sugar epimerase
MRPSKTERMRLFVSGATGPYGAHFAKLCLERGNEVFSVEHQRRPNDSASLLGIKDQITWAAGDIRDSKFLAHILADWDIQGVAHFAALPLVRPSNVIPEAIFSVNAMGTVALLEAIKQVTNGAEKRVHFLQASTDKVYGNAGDTPYVEDTPLRGTSAYEASKIAAEIACRSYQAHGFVPHLVISRSCNIVGPGDMNWRLIPNTIRQFISNVPAKVYTSGQYVREFMAVQDAVEAQYELLMRADEYAGQAFNIGSGEQWTQEEAIEHIQRTHFPEGVISRIPPPAHHRIEISYQRLDCSKIQQALGWKPKHTLADAVAEVVAWWREHRDLAAWSML